MCEDKKANEAKQNTLKNIADLKQAIDEFLEETDREDAGMDIKELETELREKSYEELLRIWRFTSVKTAYFMADCGRLFKKIMEEKKQELTQNEQVQASKNVGWEPPQ